MMEPRNPAVQDAEAQPLRPWIEPEIEVMALGTAAVSTLTE